MSNTNHLYQGKENLSQAGCNYCDGITEHAPWCATQDPNVYYAYAIVADSSKITVADELLLHSLGVVWDESHAQHFL